MSVQVENLEKSMAKLTIEVSAEQFEAAMQKAYIKNKGRIQLPGFRKGKAPRAMIEKMYGAGIFYEDAANEIIPEAYEEAAKESGLSNHFSARDRRNTDREGQVLHLYCNCSS